MKNEENRYEVNIFTPKKGYMGDEVVIIFAVLWGWGVATFGFQFLLRFVAETPSGQSLLTRVSFFNLPFHFWFTGQFLPLWFIILCVMFNIYVDRLTERHSRRRDRSHD
jgi:putative solute:sodium symporter small subunit